MYYPSAPLSQNGAPNLGTGSFVLDGASEKAAQIFAASATKSIRKVYFRTAGVTTGATLDVRIETVDASGDPSGTLWATDTNISHVLADTDDNNWNLTAALTADASVTRGDKFAVVIANPAASFGNFQLNSCNDEETSGFPYADLFTASWAKVNQRLLITVEYSDGSYEPLFGSTHPGAPVNNNTFNSGTATNERGNIFQIPFPARATGCWAVLDADGPFAVKLYDSNGTDVLCTTGTHASALRPITTPGHFFLPFTATANLAKDTNYRIVIVPTSTTNIITYDFEVPAAAFMDSFPGGQKVHQTIKTSGNWAEDNTNRVYVGVQLDAFDDGTAVGGGGDMGLNQTLHTIGSGIQA